MTQREDEHLAIWDNPSPALEAMGLYKLLSTGSTIEEIRELIAVLPRIERVLRSYAQENARDACWIEAALKFRQAVIIPTGCDGGVTAALPEELEEEELAPANEDKVLASFYRPNIDVVISPVGEGDSR